MKKAKAEIYLDKYDYRKNTATGKQSVKIRIYFNRKYRYYSTGIDLEEEEFHKVMNNKRRSKQQKNYWNRFIHYLNKANSIIDNLKVFTFDAFEEAYLENRNISNSVSYAFDQYIDELKAENRLGTAASYGNAKNSLEAYKKGLAFADVTPKLLKKYENWMIKEGKSPSTIGIYLRSLRAVFNRQDMDKRLYPFGKGKYTIPRGRNIKKALTLKEIAKIYHYEVEPNSSTEMARDYWIFLYLCNGMNVKDFCFLKWENIHDEMIRYTREKTKNTSRGNKEIEVSLKPEAMAVIKRWGVRSLSKKDYIFPHLNDRMTPEQKRRTYKQVNKNINKYMKEIATAVGIDKEVTTYYARHSFATVLKRSGANTAMISELLGHSSLAVTENYLAGFEKDQIKKQTDVLTSGFKEAK